MSEWRESWKVAESERPPAEFWTDFGNFVGESFVIETDERLHDYYWSTLINWADILMKRYHGNEVVVQIVMGYIEHQSSRATDGFASKILLEILRKKERE